MIYCVHIQTSRCIYCVIFITLIRLSFCIKFLKKNKKTWKKSMTRKRVVSRMNWNIEKTTTQNTKVELYLRIGKIGIIINWGSGKIISPKKTLLFSQCYLWQIVILIFPLEKQPPEKFYKKICSYKFCKIHRITPV